jgi:hypothetical protein
MIELQQNNITVFANTQPLNAKRNRKFLITPQPSDDIVSQAELKLATKPFINLASFYNEVIKYDVTMNCAANTNPQVNADTYDDIKASLMAPLFRCCNVAVQHPTSIDRLNNYNEWCVPNDDTIDMLRKGDDLACNETTSLTSFNLKYKQNQIPYSNKNANGRAPNADDKPYQYQHFNNWSKCAARRPFWSPQLTSFVPCPRTAPDRLQTE